MLELSWNGTMPLELVVASSRSFLEDGDSLRIRGWCQGDGYRVGFGEVEGSILAAELNQSPVSAPVAEHP